MERSTRATEQVEKPGRLQLAIVEWQRQLMAKREGQAAPLIRKEERARTGVAA